MLRCAGWGATVPWEQISVVALLHGSNGDGIGAKRSTNPVQIPPVPIASAADQTRDAAGSGSNIHWRACASKIGLENKVRSAEASRTHSRAGTSTASYQDRYTQLATSTGVEEVAYITYTLPIVEDKVVSSVACQTSSRIAAV